MKAKRSRPEDKSWKEPVLLANLKQVHRTKYSILWIISQRHASVSCQQLLGTIFYPFRKWKNNRIWLGVSSGQFSNDSKTQIWRRSAFLCIFFALTIFFKPRFPSLIQTIEWSNFTHTFLQSFSTRFISVVGVWNSFKGYWRRFIFGCFGERRLRLS